MSTPATMTKFHDSLFQSYFRKSKLLGTTAANVSKRRAHTEGAVEEN